MHPEVLRTLKILFLLQFAWLFGACGSGGGGGGGDVLAVLPPVPVAPTISAQPAPVSVVAGQPATFTVVASGSPTYQWLKGGAPLAGDTQATYVLRESSLGDDGNQYAVVVSNLAGSRTSEVVRLSVSAAPVVPSFVRGPSTVSVVAGATATFDVEVGGSSPFAYQWLRNGVAIAGAIQSSYSLVATLADHDAQISVQVTNAAGSLSSSAVPLRVAAQFVPVSIAIQPKDVTVRNGETARFSASIEGTGPFEVRWLRNGAETALGGTGFYLLNYLYVMTPALLADDGALLSLRITDSLGNTVNTHQARLTVVP